MKKSYLALIGSAVTLFIFSLERSMYRRDSSPRTGENPGSNSMSVSSTSHAPGAVALEVPDLATGNDRSSRLAATTRTRPIEQATLAAQGARIPLLSGLDIVEQELLREQIVTGWSSLGNKIAGADHIISARNHALAAQFKAQLDALDAGEYLVMPHDSIYKIEDSIYRKRPESRVVSMAPICREGELCQVVFVLDQSDTTELGVAFNYYYSLATSRQ
jgi:hypothetical protein